MLTVKTEVIFLIFHTTLILYLFCLMEIKYRIFTGIYYRIWYYVIQVIQLLTDSVCGSIQKTLRKQTKASANILKSRSLPLYCIAVINLYQIKKI